MKKLKFSAITAKFKTRTFRVGGYSMAAAVLVLSRWVKPTKKLHPILFIAASAVAGIVIGAVQ